LNVFFSFEWRTRGGDKKTREIFDRESELIRVEKLKKDSIETDLPKATISTNCKNEKK